jgi:nitrogenase molybdenum-iron protein alpha chain
MSQTHIDLTALPIDLSTNTSPNREQRALGTNIFFGQASELVRQAKSGELKQCQRKFQQTSGCLLNFYLTTRVITIRDAAVVFHGPVGCSSGALTYREVFRGIPPSLGRAADFDLHWLTTNLDGNDVVFGGAEKLKEAVREADRRYAPKAIFVVTTCTSGIIGEDVEGTLAEVRDEVAATLVPVHCEGIRSRLVQTAYDAFWHGVVKYLVRKPRRKQPDLVNVASMLSYTWQDRLEITRLLKKVGLRPNFIPEFATIDDLEQMSEAAVTAPLCPTYTDYLSRALEQEYGVPYFLYPSPMGIENTDEWLREIGRHTNKEREIEALIAEEHAVWKPKMQAIREEFLSLRPDGEKVTVLGSLGQGRMLAQTPFFHELGLDPIAALILDFDTLVLKETEDLLKKTGDFPVLVNTFQAAEKANLIKTLDPDLALTCPFQGSAYKRDKAISRIHALRGDPHPRSAQSGYAGAIACGAFLLRSYKHRNFPKVMEAKTSDTYKPWWYEQSDPLYYADRAEA